MSIARVRPLVFNEAIGNDVRRGSYTALGVSTYTLANDALNQGRFEDAAELARYTIQEAQEAFDLFTEWSAEIPQYLRERDVSKEFLDETENRISRLLHGKEGDPFDAYAGWKSYKGLIDKVGKTCAEKNNRDAVKFLEEARQVWCDTHDRLCDGVYGWVDAVSRSLGEEEIGAIWEHLMSPMYATYGGYDTVKTPWPKSLDKLMHVALEGLRGHLSGPGRLGDLEVEELADRWVIRFNPCGSGGRTMRDDLDSGTGPRMEAPYDFGVTTKPHDWSWGKTGVCLYCVHCCVLNERMPIRRFGYPTRVVEPPIWPESKSGSKCTWNIYKDPSLVPEDVYHRTGGIKPNMVASKPS